MRAKSRLKILTTIFSILMFLFSLHINITDTPIFQIQKNPKTSYTYSGVKINDLPGSTYNWVWASGEPWFGGGSGLPGDPYIIESGNHFTASGSANCFLIEHSRKYFIIEGCFLEYSGSNAAGLKLYNVSNGQIIGNYIYGNYNGIYLSNCSNNVISDNYVYDNEACGINVEGSASLTSKNNTITSNVIYQNNNSGINLVFSDFCNVSGNAIAYNLEKGIEINASHNTLISENGIYYNDYGISCIESLYNNMTYNRIESNSWHGIDMEDSNYTNLYRNHINDQNCGIEAGSCFYSNISGNIAERNLGEGIRIAGGGNNTISNNTALSNGRGINLQFSNNNTIIGNNASNNDEYGIVLVSSSENNIMNNNLSYNYFGIYTFTFPPFDECDNNDIIDNTLNNNFYGMDFDGNFNNISENKANNNRQTGIQIRGDNNNLSKNILCNNSYYGIYISDGDNYVLTENEMRYCGLQVVGSKASSLLYSIDTSNTVNNKLLYFYKEKDGLNPNNFSNAGQIILINCDNSRVKNVNVSYCSCGVYLYNGINNTLTDINASYNSDSGLKLESGHHNKIIGVNASNNEAGIRIANCQYNNISSNILDKNEWTGIYFNYNCNYNNISANNISFNGRYGIYLDSCHNNNFTNNKMIYCGLIIEGSLWDLTTFSSNSIDTSNLVNEKPLYYYVSQNNLRFDNFSNPGQIILINCNNSIISNLELSYTSIGVYLFHCKNNQIYHSNITYNKAKGLMIEECYNITILENHINNNGFYGIELRDSDNNKILNCTITNLEDYSIYIGWGDRNNIIYYNNIDGGAYDDGINNLWDDGYAGNYWADYTGVDLNQDGIGDSNYTIAGNAKANDTKPLMYQIKLDTDGDGLINYEEYTLGKDNYRTNVTNPDSDNDGLSDYWEWLNLTNPWNPDTDYDNMPDLWEILNSLNPLSGLDNLTDDDNDLLPNLYEFLNGTNPNNNDTDGDTFLDGKEVELKTNPLNRWWYPMPNLKVTNFTVSDVFEGQPFVLDFIISNNGIWATQGIIIIIRCESIGITLYNNTDTPIDLNVDESKHIIADCTKLSNPGVYSVTLIIDPDNLINETYSLKDGNFNIDWEKDNVEQIQMQIIAVSGDGAVPFDFELLIWILAPLAVGCIIILGGVLTKRKYEQIKVVKGKELKAREDLNKFEQQVRMFIKNKLKEFYKDDWWKKGVPFYIRNTIEPKIKDKLIKKADISLDGIDFLDFEHYFPIISEKQNWDEIFSNTFSIVNNINEPFESLKVFNNKLYQKQADVRDLAKYPIYIYAITKYFMKEINVFLSYSTLDTNYFKISEIAKRLEKYPEINKILFWELDSGEDVVDYMERSLKISKTFILFCSENSIKSKSVEDEWKAAFQLRKKGLIKIIPVYEDEKLIPVLLTPLLNVKFDQENFEIFVENLYKEILRS